MKQAKFQLYHQLMDGQYFDELVLLKKDQNFCAIKIDINITSVFVNKSIEYTYIQ